MHIELLSPLIKEAMLSGNPDTVALAQKIRGIMAMHQPNQQPSQQAVTQFGQQPIQTDQPPIEQSFGINTNTSDPDEVAAEEGLVNIERSKDVPSQNAEGKILETTFKELSKPEEETTTNPLLRKLSYFKYLSKRIQTNGNNRRKNTA